MIHTTDASSGNGSFGKTTFLRPRRARALAALSLAVAVAAPLGVTTLSSLRAAEPARPVMLLQQPTLAPSEALKEGVRQFNARQFEEAVATLQAIDASALNDAERKTLTDTLQRADTSAAQRKSARAEFELGQESLRNNRPGAAIVHYNNVINNSYADEPTRQKAREQIALANAQRGGAPAEAQDQAGGDAPSGSPRELYVAGRNQYKEGDWVAARKNLTAAMEAGYKPRLFEDGPQTILARMDKKEQADSRRAAQQPSRDRTAVAAAPAPTPAPAPAPAPTAGQPAPAPAAPVAVAQAAPAPQPAPAPAQAAPAPAPAPAPRPQTTPAPAAPAPVPPPAAPRTQQVPPPAPAPRATPDQQLADTARMQGTATSNNAARAKQLVEQGRKREQANDFQGALDAYSEASQLDPNNTIATAGRNNMLALLGRSAAPSPALDRVKEQINIRRQELQYNFETAIEQAQAATSRNDFASADAALNQARNARNVDPNIFTESELKQFDGTINSTQLALTQARQDAERQQMAQQQADTARAIALQREDQRRARESTIADLRVQARQLINETKYTEALGVIDQILVLEPTNDYATGIRPLVEDKALFQQQRRFREDFDRQFTRQLNASEEKKIPYDDILRYPSDWPDISERRDQTVAAERGEGGADQATQAQLDKKLPDLRFDAIGFSDVVDFLRDVTGANIFVNWRALEAAGIDRNAPVTARLRDVKFSKALDTILADVGGGLVQLGYTIDEGVITISTEEDLSRNVATRVYDIRDLIVEVPDFNQAPTFNLDSQTNQTSGQGGGGGGGQSLFGGGQGGSGQEEGQRTRQQLVEEITLLITDTVAPDSWRDAGGTVGSIRELQGQLIVTQTPENQRLLQGLLEQLRETRAIQVTVEARFLTVQRNYLEDIGFDVDATFNVQDGNDKWSPVPVSNNSIQFTANPSTGVPGSLATNLASGGEGVGGLGLSALGLTATYLDNFTVTFLLRATQAAQSSTLVTAPRLTLFNGQRAYVLVSRQTAYVSDLEPIVAQQAVAFNPTIGLVQSGVLLDVQATVSSDRKYVTLTLRPQLATLIDLLPFTFQSTEGQAGTTQPIPDGQGGFVGTNPATGTIQQPILQITEVRTTVSVPDGGTLLLGGQTIAGEIEREAGIPVLSKIPFLKRLFTNRSMAKDEQILLILVKPTIVIQREQEQRQFPLLSSRIAQ